MTKESISSVKFRRSLNAFMVLAFGLLLIPSVHADKITRTNGRSLEGIIRKENAFYVYIDVRGVIVPVPRETIKEVIKLVPKENARILTDRAIEALSRGDITASRILIDQAQSLNVEETDLIQTMKSFEAEVADMERRGGTPEARRQRADAMLKRALESFDRIRVDEGKDLLIQSLMIDPDYDKAHDQMSDLLMGPAPDLQLAAQYFAEILWPDNVRDNSPVIDLLPRIYVDLIERQTQSTEDDNIRRNSDLLKVLADAFLSRASWKMNASAQMKALLDQPLNVIMTDIIKKNLSDNLYQAAYAKLQTWATPEDSPESTLLYVRAMTGMGDYTESIKLLEQGLNRFASETTLGTQYNALTLAMNGLNMMESGDVTGASKNFNLIIRSRTTLAPEITAIAGRELATLKVPQMEQLATTPPLYEAANIASIVLEFGTDPLQKRRAAEIIEDLINKVPWRLEGTLMAGDNAIKLPEDLASLVEESLSPQLAVTYDAQSSFVLRFRIGMDMSPEQAGTLIQAAESGQPIDAIVFDTPLDISALRFLLEANHPGLGTMFQENWSFSSLPAAIALRREAGGDTTHQEDKPVLLSIESLASISQFIMEDLPEYLSTDVTLLTSHLEIPMVNEQLNKAASKE